MMLAAALTVGAYLLGSMSTAIMVCRLSGAADPRDVGSGNPGATNVLRHAGRGAAAVTLVGDVGKGALPVVLAAGLGIQPPWLTAIGLAAFLGHLFPIYYAFRGGKGVATFLGVNLALEPWLGLLFMGVWFGMALASRYSSLAALIAALVVPPAAFWLGADPISVGLYALMTILIYWRHHANIVNLVHGTEKRIGSKT